MTPAKKLPIVSIQVQLGDDDRNLLYDYQQRLQERFAINIKQSELMRRALRFAFEYDNGKLAL